jgi:glycosyltransferase involved in cell wall biosynthesis
MKVLLTADYYLPGSRAGGPIRSLANLVERLGDEVSFRVVTRDRDCGAAGPYPDVQAGRWVRVGKAEVLYLSPRTLSLSGLRGVLRQTPHDVLYLNSFFSPFTIRSLLLRKLGQVPRAGVLVSPKGELSSSALAISRWKKQMYAPCARALGLYRGHVWQASSPLEAKDILRHPAAAPPADDVLVVPDLSAAPPEPESLGPPPQKVPGSLRVVYLARIARIKNLDGALGMLAGLPGEVEFTIHGPVEDEAYWLHCQKLMAELPGNVRARYAGPVEPGEVAATLRKHHLFLLPTQSENFGHAIIEALGAGCPALVSDRTPWTDLDGANAGWALPLEQPERFREALRRCLEMDGEAHSWLCAGAARYAAEVARRQGALDLYRRMFEAATRRGS